MRSDCGPFAVVPLWVLRAGLSSSAVHVYAVLAAVYADRNGRAWPKQQTIAEQTGLSVDTVSRCLKELQGVGALLKERRWRDKGVGGAKSTMLTLCYAKPGNALVTEQAVLSSGNSEKSEDTSVEVTPENQNIPPGGNSENSGDTQQVSLYEPNLKKEPHPVSRKRNLDTSKVTNARILDAFCERWRQKYGHDYEDISGWDGKQAAQMASRIQDWQLISDTMDRFFASNLRYYADTKHKFASYVRDFNGLKVEVAKRNRLPDTRAEYAALMKTLTNPDVVKTDG